MALAILPSRDDGICRPRYLCNVAISASRFIDGCNSVDSIGGAAAIGGDGTVAGVARGEDTGSLVLSTVLPLGPGDRGSSRPGLLREFDRPGELPRLGVLPVRPLGETVGEARTGGMTAGGSLYFPLWSSAQFCK